MTAYVVYVVACLAGCTGESPHYVHVACPFAAGNREQALQLGERAFRAIAAGLRGSAPASNIAASGLATAADWNRNFVPALETDEDARVACPALPLPPVA